MVFKKIPSAIGFIADVWALLSAIIGIGGGVVLIFLKDIPIYYPIIAIVLILFAVIRMILNYLKWRKITPLVASELLDTTRILKDMGARVSELMMMSRLVKIDLALLKHVQEDLRKRTKIGVDYWFVHRDIKARQELVMREIKKAKLRIDTLNEKHVNFMLNITWVLNKHKIGYFHQMYNPDDAYKKLELKLSPKISTDSTKNSIIAYKDICLGINSIIVFQDLFPQEYKSALPEMDKSYTEWIHDRDHILDSYLQYVYNNIKSELYEKY